MFDDLIVHNHFGHAIHAVLSSICLLFIVLFIFFLILSFRVGLLVVMI